MVLLKPTYLKVQESSITALRPAGQRSSRAQASMEDLQQRHEAHNAELQASHAAELQQLLVCSPQAGQSIWSWPFGMVILHWAESDAVGLLADL